MKTIAAVIAYANSMSKFQHYLTIIRGAFDTLMNTTFLAAVLILIYALAARMYVGRQAYLADHKAERKVAAHWSAPRRHVAV